MSAPATNVIRLYGYYHLAGQTASVFLAGLDCGDYVVAADGTIDVPLQSDPDQLLTAGYLQTIGTANAPAENIITLQLSDGVTTINVQVPCVVGYTYTSQGQALRPETPDVIKSPKGPGLGKTRRTHMYSLLVTNTGGVSIGTSFSSLYPVGFHKDDRTTPLPSATPFSGVHWDTLQDDYSFDSMICWQVTRPYAAAIQSVGAFLDTQDR